ncbi:MAG: FAD-dependent thymidylate synthase [Candidatus Omnitrophica bacterium]|nr:FAD-dependent thymidylate synthase [Candidatus Omnitrophota bacterium]
MREALLKVELLGKTENAKEIIYSACRQCYSADFSGNIFANSLNATANPDTSEKITAFIEKVVASGHESPLEHVKFTFAIEGVSRALTHQLVRHRIASYSQQSQRYVKASEFKYIVPPVFEKNDDLKQRFLGLMTDIQEGYNGLLSLLEKNGTVGEKANQDARFVLPQAAETKIVVTMNARELKHFFAHRCCHRAQWEIRRLAEEMLKICRKVLPEVFNSVGAKCEALKYCPEGEKFTCGKYNPR